MKSPKLYTKLLLAGSLLVASSAFTSCEDFLTILPTDQIPEESFWQDKADLENVRAGAYEKLTQSGQTSRILMWGEIRSDNLELNNMSQTTISYLQSAVLQPTEAIFDWSGFYTGINYCNLVLEQGEAMTVEGKEVDPSFTRRDWNIAKSEVMALRALYYFYLVRAYRDVPFVTKSVRTDAQARNERPEATPGVAILGELISELEANVGEENAMKLREDLELVDGVYPAFNHDDYLAARVAPVFFGSALNNFGVKELLDCFVKIAPYPRPTKAEERMVNPDEQKFTGFIFKITANIDPNHRSCIAFCKVCSGKFVRNAPYLHVRQGKTVRFSSPTQFMAQRKSTIDEAWAGDIVGLPDNGIFKIGDTLTEGEQLHFRGLPSFSPEMFKYIENADPMKTKQLQRGIEQLMDEGVAQLFVNQFNGRKIIGTVGQLQFEVIQYRLENEYNAKCRWEPVSLYKACWIESDDPAELEAFKKRKYQYMAKDREGRDVFLADSGYVLQMAQQDFKNIRFHFTSEF